MPSTYAHRRFGANVLDYLPAPLREKLEAHRELYDIGLHGPDVLFYYHAEKSTSVAALGNAMHDEPGRTFFDRARRVVHVLYRGRIIHTGDKTLALKLEKEGYDWLINDYRE